MSLCEMRWHSRVLDKQVVTNIILPDTGQGHFPVFYLLHGLSDDYAAWARRTRIEMYVRNWPLIVVMPDGYRGFYTNNSHGPAYATYIAEELVHLIDRTFPTRPTRSARAIGGLSMGGYGALRLALGYPDRFLSATSHSGAMMHGHHNRCSPDSALARDEFHIIFGSKPRGSDHDLLTLARRCKARGRLPRLRIDCGTEDFLLDDNRAFHLALQRLKIPHEYEQFPGEHNWDYWDTHIQRALRFHARHLKLAID
jgi:putative tributyrin esterase